MTSGENVELNQIFGGPNTSSSAIIIGANGRFGKGGSYYFESRYTEPYYVAFGAPNLRQDHFRLASRVRQSMFKAKVNLAIGYEFNRDNLSLTKPAISLQTKLTLNARVKISKSLQLGIGYTPVWSDIIYIPTSNYYSTYMGLSSASIIHQKRYRDISNMFNVSYQGSHMQVSLMEKSTTTLIHYLSALNTLILKRYDLSISGSATAYTSNQTDSSYGYGAGASFKKQHPKVFQVSYGMGARYQFDRTIERRYVLSAEISIVLPYQIYGSFKADQHLIRQKEAGIEYNSQQFSILITKRF